MIDTTGTDKEGSPAPAFDDTRAALVFALNAGRVDMPRPYMNKALAAAQESVRQATAAALWKRVRRDKKAQVALLNPDDPLVRLAMETAPRARKTPPPGPRPLQGLDRAHQAGYILSQFARLDPAHQVVLRGLLVRAYEPCGCRSPCCSGRRRSLQWANAVKDTCLLLERVGDVAREPGKRGLSTQPAMRLALVEQFYTKGSLTVAAAAAIGQVSTVTATRHRDWIFAWLEQTEDEAWLSADALFDQVGITGSFANQEGKEEA